jgi:CDP-diacylglycerol--serine O-phosphatidyltransferase
MKKNIPNLITLLNLATGVLGIIFLLRGKFDTAVYLVFIAGIFDFLDGFTARLLKAWSDIGKSLDSLADIISFGVLPSLLIYYSLLDNPFHGETLKTIIPYIALFIPAFSAVRLAVFNNDPDQKENFKGLPTPANAFLISSASLYYMKMPAVSIIHTALLLIVVIAGCNLMVSGLKMFSFKFSKKDKAGSIRNIIFLVLSLALILIFKIGGVFLAIILYILLSVAYSLRKQTT